MSLTSAEYAKARAVHAALKANANLAPLLVDEVLSPDDQVRQLETAAALQGCCVAVSVGAPEVGALDREGFPGTSQLQAAITIEVLAKREVNKGAHEAVCAIQDEVLRTLHRKFTDEDDSNYWPRVTSVAEVDLSGTSIPADTCCRQVTINSYSYII